MSLSLSVFVVGACACEAPQPRSFVHGSPSYREARWSGSREGHEPRKQRLKVRRAQARHRVPPPRGREALRPAPRVRPVLDIIERGREQMRVQRGVDPPDGALARGDARVVDGGDERRKDRRARARAAARRELAVDRDDGREAVRGHVRVRAPGRVERARVVARGDGVLQVPVHAPRLEGRLREDVREPAAGGERRRRRLGVAHRVPGGHLGRADRGHVGAGRGELGDEGAWGVVLDDRAVLGDAGFGGPE